MRTAKEILFHMYTAEKILAEAVQRGELLEEGSKEYTPEDEIGAAAASKIRTVKDMQQYAQLCHDNASEALAEITDAELARTVRSTFGEFTGAQFLTFLYDEHWHHRGQFYTYLRLMEKEHGSHHLPHLHAYYQEHVGIYGLDPIELIAG